MNLIYDGYLIVDYIIQERNNQALNRLQDECRRLRSNRPLT